MFKLIKYNASCAINGFHSLLLRGIQYPNGMNTLRPTVPDDLSERHPFLSFCSPLMVMIRSSSGATAAATPAAVTTSAVPQANAPKALLEAELLEVLDEDPQVKVCTQYEVKCRYCSVSRACDGDMLGTNEWWRTHKQGCKRPEVATSPSSSFTFWFPSAVFGSSQEPATSTPAPPESSSGSDFSDDDDADENLGPKAIKPWFLEPEEKRDPRNIAFRNELQNDPQVWWYNRWNVMCNACGRAAVAMMGTPVGEEQRNLVRNWRGHKVICDA